MEAKENLNNLAKITNNIAETRLTEILFGEILKSSPIFDKFSTWLLIGTGATASLMITNLEKISPIVGRTNLKDSIYLLTVSALLGFLAKFKYIHCQTMLAINEQMKEQILLALGKYNREIEEINNLAKENNHKIETNLDFENVINNFTKAFPRFTHSKLFKEFKEGTEDQLTQGRKNANSVFWQGVYTNFQLLAFISCILFIAYSL